VNFPAILEGDLPNLINAAVNAMTLGNKLGEVTGIDEKAGVRKLFEFLDIEHADEILEQMYPESTYDPDRTKEPTPVQNSDNPIAAAAGE